MHIENEYSTSLETGHNIIITILRGKVHCQAQDNVLLNGNPQLKTVIRLVIHQVNDCRKERGSRASLVVCNLQV